MLEYLKYLIFLYFGMYILIFILSKGRLTIGFISWLHLIKVKINFPSWKLSASSISLQIRPMYYLHRKKLKATHHDGLIVVHIYKLNIDTSNLKSTANSNSNSTLKSGKKLMNPMENSSPMQQSKLSNKLILSLQWLRWILPITFVLHDTTVQSDDEWLNIETLSTSFNCDLINNELTDTRELRNSIHFSLSNISNSEHKVIKDLKWTFVSSNPINSLRSLKFSKLISSCVCHGVNIDLDKLKLIISKLGLKKSNNENAAGLSGENKINEKLNESKGTDEYNCNHVDEDHANLVQKLFSKFDKTDIYFAFDESKLKSKGNEIYLKNAVFSANSTDKNEVFKKFKNHNLCKLTFNISGLKILNEVFKKSKVQVEFLNFFVMMDIKALLYCYKYINDTEKIHAFTSDDAFLARGFLTITNASIFTTIEDIIIFQDFKRKNEISEYGLKNNNPNSSDLLEKVVETNKKSNVFENILCLTHKIGTRAQFLTFTIQVTLSKSLKMQFLVDDLLLDSSMPDSVSSLYDTDLVYIPKKSISISIRNVQCLVVDAFVPHKFFVIDLITYNTSIAAYHNSVVVDDLSIVVNHIEYLAENISIWKKLANVADDYVARERKSDIETVEELNVTVVDASNDSTNQFSEKPRSKSFLPDLIQLIKVNVHKVTFRACFTNPVKYWDGEDQSDINDFKRGISLAFYEFSIKLDNTVDIPICDIRLKSFKAFLNRDYDSERNKKCLPTILDIQNLHSKYIYKTNTLSTTVPLIDASISVEVLWTVLFVKAILESLKGRKSTGKDVIKISNKNKVDKPADSKLHILFSLPLLMLKLQLPSQVDLALEIDSLKFSHVPSKHEHKNLSFKVIRFYGQNPHAKGFWTLLFIISNAAFRIKSKSLVGDSEPEIGITCGDIRIEIPFQYVFYKTFDNLKAFFKSIKKLKLNFHDLMFIENSNKDFKVDIIKPSLVDTPLRLPKIRIISKRIMYYNHDDPFEEELTRIIMLGKMEQQVRLTKLKEFEKYEANILERLKEKYEPVLEFENNTAIIPKNIKYGISGTILASEKSVEMKKSFSTGILSSSPITKKRTNSISINGPSKLSNQIFSEECESWLEYQREYHIAIEIPRKKLYANISKSWTSRIKSANRIKQISDNNGSLQSDPKVRKEFLRKFPVIVEGNFKPLFGFKVSDCILDLNEPEFGLENYADYIHRVANGVPKDMKYGILVPMNLKLSCSEMKVQIKDYPIPLLGFGGNEKDDSNSVKFDGDLVICEQKYTEEEIRYNFVSCVPQYNDPRMKDNLYAFHIARTMTNVKFITEMNVYVDSAQSASASWAPSLQPGMSYSFDSFDLLSKPPLDISPKIGFWDKMPLLVPSRFTFNFKKGITLFIKASQSPYQLVGRQAGFAFKWDEDVKVSINKTGKSEDFLIVESKVFEIGVPAFDQTKVANPLNPGTPHALNHKIAKVILRLTSKPIIWKLGFIFERNKNNEPVAKPGNLERTRDFIAHYDVSLKNPDTFTSEEEKELWDSYKDWRSHYIYLALSIYSRDDNKCKELSQVPLGSAFNSLYLTPMSVYYFFFWWDSFKSSLGLPIREGKMFRNESLSNQKSPKFSKSIFGISYSVDLSPLYLTHVYQHTSTGKNENKVAFTGLKCFVKSFTMDLHQSRREVILLDEATKTVSRELQLKMDKGIIDFVDADLRLLTAIFNQTSAAGMLVKQLGLDKTSTNSFIDTDASSSNSEDYTDRVWYDHNDFIELEAQKIPDEEPKWKAYEFASSPRFYYVRDNPTEDVEYPFDYIETQTHNCQLGERDVSHAAAALTDRRISEIEDQINFFKPEVSDLMAKSQNLATAKVLETRNKDLQELHHRLHVLRSLRDSFNEGIFPNYDEFLNDQEISDDEALYELSKVQSRVSSHISKVKSRISTAPIQSSQYRNRFSIYTINVKWTKHTKSGLLRYFEKVKDRRFTMFSMSQQAVNLANDLSKAVIPELEEDTDFSFLKNDPEFEFLQSKKMLDDFDQVLHDTSGLAEAETDDSYLFKLILPQIAITTDNNRCILITSNRIVMRSITVKGFNFDETVDEITLPVETRNGLMLTEAFAYCMDRESVLTNKHRLFTPRSFSWPPKLPLEMHFTPVSLDECIVAQNISCAILINKPNSLHYSKDDPNKISKSKDTIRIVAPDFNITTTSDQFRTLVDTFKSAFEHDETEIQKVKEMVKRIVKYSDFSDFKSFCKDLKEIQSQARQLLECRKLLVSANFSNPIYTEDIEAINVELERILLNLNAMVDILQSSKAKRYNQFHKFSQWIIMAPSITIQFLDDDSLPIVEVSAVDAYYTFTQSANGESVNTVYVYDFALYDRHPKATCETVLTRFKDSNQPLFRVDWHLLPPVGGIKIIKKKVFCFAPIRVEFDMRFAAGLQEFMFPKSKILQNSSVFDDEDESDEDDFYTDTDSTSDTSSIMKTVSNQSNLALNSSHKEGSKISKAFHRLLPKGIKSVEPNSKMVRDKDKFFISGNSKALDEPSCSNVKTMESRSAKYYMMSHIIINEIETTVTFKGSGKLSFINLTDFHVTTPIVEIVNRLMSNEEMFAVVRKQLVTSVLKNTHNIIKSTFKQSKSSKGAPKNPKINPILRLKERRSLGENKKKTNQQLIHSHKHRPENAHTKFRDADLLGPQIHKPETSNQEHPLMTLKQQDRSFTGSVDELSVFKPLEEIDEEE